MCESLRTSVVLPYGLALHLQFKLFGDSGRVNDAHISSYDIDSHAR
jgi:hypothetical protein